MRRPHAVLLTLLALPACAANAARAPREARSAAFAPSAPPAAHPPYGESAGAPVTQEADAAKASLVTTASTESSDDGGSSAPVSPGATPAAAVDAQPSAQEMLDIEARVSIEVDKVGEAAASVRALAKKHGGQIVADTVNDDAGSSAASFTFRVPSKGSDGFLDDLGGVGIVRNRQVTARDIGKEFHDAQIHLNNLMTTLKRYEEVLAKAQDVNQILAIEREMTRIRGEIDRVKGDLRWMKDRAARATIHVTIFTSRPDSTPTFDPKAKVHPGLRTLHFADFRGGAGSFGFLGFGLSIAGDRAFSLDFDGMRNLGSPGRGLDAFLVTIGGELYSDFLGAGRRTFLNPYIGWRAGYARIAAGGPARDELLLGGTFGLELYKTRFFRLDAQTRLLGLFGNKDVGGHLGVQSGLQAHFAF
jgi:hypothetical protein